MSRLFDRDRDRVIERAKQSGVGVVVCWISDIEKLESLADTCRSYSGTAYFIAGIHPDNIDRTNKKLHDTWLEKIEELSKRAECVGLLAGLNLSREIGTHFSQESLFRSTCALATKLGLPLTLHITDSASLAKAVELLLEEGRGRNTDGGSEDDLDRGQMTVLHDAITACSIDASKLRAALEAVDLYCEFTPLALADDDENNKSLARACLEAVSRDRILLGCDSPWKTPQNLTDAYLRTLRNEPSKIHALYSAVAAALGEGTALLAPAFLGNAIRVYGQWAAEDSGGTGEAAAAADVSSLSPAPLLQAPGGGNTAGEASELSSSTAPATEPAVSDAPQSAGSTSSRLPGPAAAWYVCHKCRCQLFPKSAVLSHDVANMTRSKNTVVGEGICTAALFLAGTFGKGDADTLRAGLQQLHIAEGGNAGSKASKRSSAKPAAEATGGGHSVVHPVCVEARLGTGDISQSATVECPGCSCKLGRWSLVDAPCPCGIMVPGPSLRVATAKVDLNEGSNAGPEELATIARNEALRTQAENALNGADRGGDELEKKKKKKKKKMEKAGNKGNYSSFRNKSFIPNASRVNKALQAAAAAVSSATPGGEGEGGDSSSSSGEQSSSDEDDTAQVQVQQVQVQLLDENAEDDEGDEEEEGSGGRAGVAVGQGRSNSSSSSSMDKKKGALKATAAKREQVPSSDGRPAGGGRRVNRKPQGLVTFDTSEGSSDQEDA